MTFCNWNTTQSMVEMIIPTDLARVDEMTQLRTTIWVSTTYSSNNEALWISHDCLLGSWRRWKTEQATVKQRARIDDLLIFCLTVTDCFTMWLSWTLDRLLHNSNNSAPPQTNLAPDTLICKAQIETENLYTELLQWQLYTNTPCAINVDVERTVLQHHDYNSSFKTII